MEHVIYSPLYINVLGDIVFEEEEIVSTIKRGEIGEISGNQIVDTDDLMPSVQQIAAKMGTNKTGPPRNDDSAHGSLPLEAEGD